MISIRVLTILYKTFGWQAMARSIGIWTTLTRAIFKVQQMIININNQIQIITMNKGLIENMRSGDKNNWNMSSNQFVNFASSLSSLLAQSVKGHRNPADPPGKHKDLSVNLNLNDSQLKLPIEVLNSLCNSTSANVENKVWKSF